MQQAFGKSDSTAKLGIGAAGVVYRLALGNAVSILAAGISFLVVARLLGPSSYGVYILAMGIVGFAASIGGLVVGRYLDAHIPTMSANGKAKEIGPMIGSTLLIVLILGIAATAIGLVFSSYITAYVFHSATYLILVRIAMLAIVISVLYGGAYSAIIGFGDGNAAALVTVSNSVVQAVTSISLVLIGFGALGAVLGYELGIAIGIFIEIATIIRHTRIGLYAKGMGTKLHHTFAFSLPLGGANILTSSITNFAVILLGLLFLPSVAGVYGVAANIGHLFGIITGAIGFVLVPTFASTFANMKLKNEANKVYNYSLYFGFMLITPLVAYVATLSNALVSSVFLTTYAGAAQLMALISIGTLLQLIVTYGTSVAVTVNKTRKVLKYTIIISILELSTLAFLVPLFGALGAVISIFFVGGITGASLYSNYILKVLGPENNRNVAALIAPNLLFAMLLAIVALSGIYYTLQLVIGIALLLFLYPPLLAATRALTRKESRFLRDASQNVPAIGSFIVLLTHYAEVFMR
jgi:O-antigen/teichoic acid export membrane protein